MPLWMRRFPTVWLISTIHTVTAIGRDRPLEVDVVHLLTRVALHLVGDVDKVCVAVRPWTVLAVRTMLGSAAVGDRLLVPTVVADQFAKRLERGLTEITPMGVTCEEGIATTVSDEFSIRL